MTERSLKELARETAQSVCPKGPGPHNAFYPCSCAKFAPLIEPHLQRAVADAREECLKLACESVCRPCELAVSDGDVEFRVEPAKRDGTRWKHKEISRRHGTEYAEFCSAEAIRRAFAAAQDQDCGCKGPTCEWTDKPIRRAAQDDPEVSR